MGVQIDLELQTPIQRWIHNDVRDVLFQITSGERVHSLLGQEPQFAGEPVAKIEAGEFVPPGSILKTLHGLTIDLRNVAGSGIGAKEIRESVIEAGVVRIAIDFASV